MMRPPLRACLSAFLLLCGCSALRAVPLTFRADASAAWVDNLSRTSNPPDQAEGSRLSATLSAQTFRDWKSGYLTSVDVSLTQDLVPDYRLADVTTGAFRFGVRRKLGLGAYAPVIDASAGAAYRGTRLPAAEGWSGQGSVGIGKRLTPALRLAGTADWQSHNACHETFDVHERRLFASVHWDITPTWQLSGGAGRSWGDYTANAAWTTWAKALSGALGPVVFERYNQLAWERTDVFGPGSVAYRVGGRANFHWLELSPAIGRNTSLGLRVERITLTNMIGIKYRQDLVSLNLLHRF